MSGTNVSSLFANAQQGGLLTPAAANVVDNIPDLGQQIQAGLGIVPDDVTASEVTLVGILLDDSGSMVPNTQVACDGVNLILDSLLKTKQRDTIFLHCRLLNDGVLYPFTPLANVPRLTSANYRPLGGTPLLDEMAVMFAMMVAKTQEFADAGVPCRAITLIITDGADGSSRIRKPQAIQPVVASMLKTEAHIVAAMGIDDGSTDYRDFFTKAGLQPNWILTPGNSPSDIRRAFAFASQSAVRVSQAAVLAPLAAGGFGTP